MGRSGATRPSVGKTFPSPLGPPPEAPSPPCPFPPDTAAVPAPDPPGAGEAAPRAWQPRGDPPPSSAPPGPPFEALPVRGRTPRRHRSRRGPRRHLKAVGFDSLEWVDWFNNRWLLEPIGNVPPAESEDAYYRHREAPASEAGAN